MFRFLLIIVLGAIIGTVFYCGAWLMSLMGSTIEIVPAAVIGALLGMVAGYWATDWREA